jgi:hypothetical protein
MAEIIDLRPSDLLIDVNNPRIPEPSGQREAARALATDQNRKLVELAQDIVQYGLNPADLPIVAPMQDDLHRYIVLEGNRRLVALKALENPDSFQGSVSQDVLAKLRELSHAYQSSPIDAVRCCLIKDRDKADHWIKLRHTGENKGAGIVPWGSVESDRFRSRSGSMELSTQVLNFLEDRGHLTAADRREVAATNLKRLLGTPEFRQKIGVGLKEGKLVLLGRERAVAKAVLHVLKDFAPGNKKVGDIYSKAQRVAYANALPAHVVVKSAKQSGRGTLASSLQPQSKPKRPVKPQIPRERDHLIPRDCALNVTDPRAREIESELRTLSMDNYHNAVAVLFRVFIELSVDAYLADKGLSVTNANRLHEKIQHVTTDLVARKKLTQGKAVPVRRAMQKDSFLASSVEMLHAYVHSQHVFPLASDLRAGWNNLQPFVIALWST